MSQDIDFSLRFHLGYELSGLRGLAVMGLLERGGLRLILLFEKLIASNYLL